MALLDFLNPLNAITDGIVKWQIAKENAKTNEDKIAAEVKIKELETRRDLQVAATINDRWWSPRVLFGWMVVILFFKLVVWDTAFGLGVTEYPGKMVMDFATTVVAFYFGGEAIKSVGNGIATAIAQRK